MTVIRLAYIHKFRDRRGRVRYYFRRGTARVALPGQPGSEEFMAAYRLALAQHGAPDTGPRVAAGSLAACVNAYFASAEYKTLAGTTQRTYRNVLLRVSREYGDKPLALLKREHVRRIVALRAETPEAANSLLKMLRVVMKFAVAEGMRRDDPTVGVKRLRTRSEGFATWTEHDIAQFEAHWPIGSRQRLAFALLLYTGQRRGDVVQLGLQHFRDGRLELRQNKTGARLSLPIHPRLREAMDAHPRLSAAMDAPTRADLALLVTDFGRSFSVAGFGNWFREAVTAAGLSGVSAHGLRKAAARRLAEAGCTAHEIMAVTGHKTLSEVAHYTAAADQATRANAAMGKVS